MKSIIVLTFFTFIFAFCNAQSTVDPSAINTSASVAKQDSMAALQAEAIKYLDSLEGKISVKEFKKFLYENISVKEYTESPFQNLLNFFNQQKLNAWLAERAKKQTPKSPPKKN